MRPYSGFLFLALCLPVHAHWNVVDLETEDGLSLKASYISPARKGPAMLLLHQCNQDRSSWAEIGKQLHDAGIHVLTLDLRGFGDSEGDGLKGDDGFPGFLARSQSDVDLAFDYLVGQDLVDKGRVGVGGASCGAMLSAELATRRDVRALMLLSGPPSDAAVAYIGASPDLAVFAAAATEDVITPGVYALLKRAVALSPHPKSTAKIFSGSEHGTPLFGKHDELEPTLIAWLTQALLDP